MRILLVEDEIRMAQAVCEMLRLEKYEVDHYENGYDGLAACQSNIYDVIILDVMLPGISGFDIVVDIRKKGIHTPVLMLTAKSDIEDKITGLDNGADDYLTKPFMMRELLARIRALYRRNINSTEGVISFSDIYINSNNYKLYCSATGQCIQLSDKEYRILEYLISNAGHILSREQLVLKIWGYDNESEYNNVEVYMTFTRKKLSFVGAKAEIKAVRGLGYVLRCGDV